MKNPLDQLSPDDMKAFGDALGSAVSKPIIVALSSLPTAVMDALEAKYESVTITNTTTIKLNPRA